MGKIGYMRERWEKGKWKGSHTVERGETGDVIAVRNRPM